MRRRAARIARSSFAAACPALQPRLQLRSGGGGFAGPFQRVCQADRDLVALRLDARELAQQLDGLVERALVGRVARAGQDCERGVDEPAARGRSPFDLQRVVIRRQRGGVVAGCGKRAGTARERRAGLRSDPQSLARRLRPPLSRHPAPPAAARRPRAARTRLARRSRRRARRERGTSPAGASDHRARPSLTSRRATSSSSGRSSSARSARSSSALEFVRCTSQSARAGATAPTGTSRAMTSTRRRTAKR